MYAISSHILDFPLFHPPLHLVVLFFTDFFLFLFLIHLLPVPLSLSSRPYLLLSFFFAFYIFSRHLFCCHILSSSLGFSLVLCFLCSFSSFSFISSLSFFSSFFLALCFPRHVPPPFPPVLLPLVLSPLFSFSSFSFISSLLPFSYFFPVLRFSLSRSAPISFSFASSSFVFFQFLLSFSVLYSYSFLSVLTFLIVSTVHFYLFSSPFSFIHTTYSYFPPFHFLPFLRTSIRHHQIKFHMYFIFLYSCFLSSHSFHRHARYVMPWLLITLLPHSCSILCLTHLPASIFHLPYALLFSLQFLFSFPLSHALHHSLMSWSHFLWFLHADFPLPFSVTRLLYRYFSPFPVPVSCSCSAMSCPHFL